MNRTLIALSFLAAGTVSAVAFACEHGGDHASFHQKMLERFDTNHDGKLDDTERAAMRAERVQRIFGRLDANSDGQLSTAEVKGTRLERRFTALDTDGSGTISKDELLAARHVGHRGDHALRRVIKRKSAVV
jgi:Ca2+-binding EF-hand superfamily protein